MSTRRNLYITSAILVLTLILSCAHKKAAEEIGYTPEEKKEIVDKLAEEALAPLGVQPPGVEEGVPQPRFAGEEGLGMIIGEKGLPSLSVNLSGVNFSTAASQIGSSVGYIVYLGRGVDKEAPVSISVSEAPLNSAVEVLCSPFGYYYSIDAERRLIDIKLFVTRVFDLPLIPPDEREYNLGGPQEGLYSTLSIKAQSNQNFLEELKKNIEGYLSEEGKFFIDSSNDKITVTDRFHVVKGIGNYIQEIEKFLQRRVYLDVGIIMVTLGEELTGIPWPRLYELIAQDSRVYVPEAALGEVDSILKVSRILDVQDTRPVDFLRPYLEKYGEVKVISRPALPVLNRATLYLSGGDLTPYKRNTGDKSDIALAPGGFEMSLTPRVGEDGKISLDIYSILHRPEKPEKLIPSRSHSEQFHARVKLKNRETLLLSGLIEHKEKDKLIGKKEIYREYILLFRPRII